MTMLTEMLTSLTAHSTKPTTPQQLHRLEISTAMLNILHVSAMHQVPRQRASHANATGEVREDLKPSAANSQNSLCLISNLQGKSPNLNKKYIVDGNELTLRPEYQKKSAPAKVRSLPSSNEVDLYEPAAKKQKIEETVEHEFCFAPGSAKVLSLMTRMADVSL